MASLLSIFVTLLSIVLSTVRSQENVEYTTIVETTVAENSTKEAMLKIEKFEKSESSISPVSESQEKVQNSHEHHDNTSRALSEAFSRAVMENATQAHMENPTRAVMVESNSKTASIRKFERSHDEHETEVDEVQHTTEVHHTTEMHDVQHTTDIHEVQHTTETGTENCTLATPPIGRFESEGANTAIMNVPLESFACVTLMWFGWYMYLH
ncbi:uncharacterized protein [Parasteatoda tepidariorum]|uniref:uncharacterized protein n=1 Tax=Parasteatoda tepidariorum TaxID=114398 RepID=UPI00077FB4C9|nr:uncharacterized protein LOC107450680 [Parasteatoda tepidariorum]